MRITSLAVKNYKSLRDVNWCPRQLAVIVGANASGKSNFADVHDFLSDVYRHGLSVAVGRKGGYENIAHRKMRRSRGGLAMELVAEIEAPLFLAPKKSRRGRKKGDKTRFTHSFELRAEGTTIRSDFKIAHEEIRIEENVRGFWELAVHIERKEQTISTVYGEFNGRTKEKGENTFNPYRVLSNLHRFMDIDSVPKAELIFGIVSRIIQPLRVISKSLSEIRVFQISPTDSRQSGVPVPSPEMDVHGSNLPAVVDMIIRHHSAIWLQILSIMRQIMPGLERIEVDYTHSRTLGLFFYEKGVGRAWNVAEISDGTIHSLAFLVALFDPRTTVLIIEEPENSVHTWILRTLMEAAKNAAISKQVF